ncbi:hypothetical protein AOLI_G00286280 [Acnodon oligacanthus]
MTPISPVPLGYSCHSGGEVINLRPPPLRPAGSSVPKGNLRQRRMNLRGSCRGQQKGLRISQLSMMNESELQKSLTGACPRVGPQRLISGPRVELLSQAWLSIGLPLLEPGHGAPSGSGGGQVRVKPR